MASITISVAGQITSYYVCEEDAYTLLDYISEQLGAVTEDITEMLAHLPPCESDWALFDKEDKEDDEDDEDD